MHRKDARRIAERARKRADARTSRRAQERASRRKRTTVDRHYVFLRDRGVCALCKVDTVRIDQWLERLPNSTAYMNAAPRIVYGKKDRHSRGHVNGGLIGRHRGRALVLLGRLWGVFVQFRGHFWEADHIVPVAEGGSDTLTNIRTLCLKCHKLESVALRARLRRRTTKGVGRGF